MTPFGHYLRSLRLGAGLGLRSFAKLIDQRPSTVSAIEQGHRLPWQTDAILGRVANVLGLEQATPGYELLIDLSDCGDDRDQSKTELIPLVAIHTEGGSFDEGAVGEVLSHLQSIGIPLYREDASGRLRLREPTSSG